MARTKPRLDGVDDEPVAEEPRLDDEPVAADAVAGEGSESDGSSTESDDGTESDDDETLKFDGLVKTNGVYTNQGKALQLCKELAKEGQDTFAAADIQARADPALSESMGRSNSGITHKLKNMGLLRKVDKTHFELTSRGRKMAEAMPKELVPKPSPIKKRKASDVPGPSRPSHAVRRLSFKSAKQIEMERTRAELMAAETKRNEARETAARLGSRLERLGARKAAADAEVVRMWPLVKRLDAEAKAAKDAYDEEEYDKDADADGQ